MADNTNTNSAGDMTINLNGAGADMDCGCHGHCSCGCYSHGHGHSHGGGTVITKRVSNVLYGGDNSNNVDNSEGDQCCEETTTDPSTDNVVASGTVDGNNLLLTLANGDVITIDVSGLVGGSGSVVTSMTLAADGTLTLTQSGGSDVTVDLSSLAGGGGGDTNVNVVSGSVSGGTLTLVLNDAAGTQVNIDVSSLVGGGSSGLTSVAVTGGLLSGDGTSANPLTITASNFATWLGDAANAAACVAVRACVAMARVIAPGAELDALDSTTGVVIKDAAGNLACAPLSSMLPDAPSSGVASPFDTGGDPASWVTVGSIGAGGGQTYNVPAGPAGVAGYWHLEFESATAYTWNVNSGNGAVVGAEAIVEAGATIQQTLSGGPGSSATVVTGHWHATA